MKDNNKKIILYLGGGGMAGIFGAGVANALEEADLYSRIKAVYTASAGAFNAAFFLTKQTKLGARIYYEKLTSRFINPVNILPRILQCICYKKIFKKNKRINSNAIDINYLIGMVKKKLDKTKLKKQKIPLYVKLLDLKTNKIKYFDIRKYNVFKLLEIAANILPYYFSKQKINGKLYIDACIKEPVGLEYLIKKYPNCLIVSILTLTEYRNKRIEYFKNFLENFMTKSMLSGQLSKISFKRQSRLKNINLVKNNRDILIVSPSINSKIMPYTTNKSKLMDLYEEGRNKIHKILQFVNK